MKGVEVGHTLVYEVLGSVPACFYASPWWFFDSPERLVELGSSERNGLAEPEFLIGLFINILKIMSLPNFSRYNFKINNILVRFNMYIYLDQVGCVI